MIIRYLDPWGTVSAKTVSSIRVSTTCTFRQGYSTEVSQGVQGLLDCMGSPRNSEVSWDCHEGAAGAQGLGFLMDS